MVKPTIKSNSESQDLLKVQSHCKPKIRNAILKTVKTILMLSMAWVKRCYSEKSKKSQ